jgi:hypothetical protein
MKTTITKQQIADYDKLCHERNNGRLLTSDGIRFICESYNYDPEKIGQHFLELLPKICP